MDLDLEAARRIVEHNATRPSEAYRRAAAALETGRELALSDIELAAAAKHALRLEQYATAIVIIAELELRLVHDAPIEVLTGARAA